MLLQLLHLLGRVPVVRLQDPDEVGDGQHPHKVLPPGVPQRGRPNTVVHQGEERLLNQELQETECTLILCEQTRVCAILFFVLVPYPEMLSLGSNKSQ